MKHCRAHFREATKEKSDAGYTIGVDGAHDGDCADDCDDDDRSPSHGRPEGARAVLSSMKVNRTTRRRLPHEYS